MKSLLLSFFLLLNSISFAAVIYPNQGQIKNKEVLYYSEGKEWKVYFLKDRISFVKSIVFKKENRNHDFAESLRWDLIPVWNHPKVEVSSETETKLNHISQKGSFQSKSYAKLTYSTDEFDIVFYETSENGLKYDFVYHTNGKSGQKKIKMIIDGAQNIQMNSDEISIETLLGNFPIQIPVSYCDIDQKGKIIRKKIDVKPTITNHVIEFSFDSDKNYDHVVIDPWSSFAGGTDLDEAYGSSFDTLGNVYISGYSSSTDFPVTTGVIQTTFNGLYDSFVFKFNEFGQQLWATYYGGTNNDFGNRLIVDENNQPILTGYSYSSDLTISASGVFSSTFSGIFDAFLLRLNTDGTFDWATYYGGTGGEFVTDIDYQNGELVIGGFTSSMDLPVIPTAWQNSLSGALDIFVAKFDTTGNRIWDTYYGGTNSDDAHCISFDPTGNVIVGGDTYSSDFPITSGAYQTSYSSGNDICLLKLDGNGQLLWSTFFGSSMNEDCEAIDTDEFGNIYFTGFTTGNGLPITNGLFQDNHSGDRDVIFGSFSAGGDLNWMTFAGGVNWDMPKDIHVNDGGMISIIGETYSIDFPEEGNTFQIGNNGSADVFYIVSDSLGTVSLSTLYGGSGFDSGQSISFDNLFKTALVGYTSSADLDISSDVFQAVKNGQEDAFIKIVDSTAGVYTSIENLTPLNHFTAYPNPTNGEIIIVDIPEGSYEFSIYEMNGKLIERKNTHIENQLRVTELENVENGIYFISLINEKNKFVQKIIKI